MRPIDPTRQRRCAEKTPGMSRASRSARCNCATLSTSSVNAIRAWCWRVAVLTAITLIFSATALGEVAQQSLAVARLDDDVDREHLLAGCAPVGLDQALRFARANARDVRATGAMDRDALAPGDVTDDRIGRRGLAAARESRHQPVDTHDQDPLARTCSIWHPNLPFAGAKEFARDYEAKYKRRPTTDAAYAYIACQVLEQGIKKAGSIDKEKVAAALHKEKFQTILGSYEYDERGVNKTQKGFICQVQKKERMIVWPSDMAEAKPEFMR